MPTFQIHQTSQLTGRNLINTIATVKISAGILLFRRTATTEFLLVHPGGPFWKNKDMGVWTIPKGEIYPEEDPYQAACREFKEETGSDISGNPIALTAIKQKSGKLVMAWAVEGDLDVGKIQSNLFEMEWPPRSGKKQFFPEIDKAGWYSLEPAREKMLPAQFHFIEELTALQQNKSENIHL
ncbi:MAG: NUDIX domain-containing protein [Flavisolibacter sp.]|nr:NUDIX domain-containing protein [Flavisolibacter sp.]